MEKIKHLYKGINFLTIPKVILNELRQHSNRRSSKSVRGKDGKFTTTYGDMLNPMFMYFNEYNFYINIIFYDELVKKIDTGLCFDENKIKIDKQNVALFFNEYGKGFIKGYDEFESKIKVSSSLFSVTNEQISYKIYSRIKGIWTSNIGDFKIECPINSDLTFLFTKKNFFESGINGGEFYKAWEIILNNPTIFESIFLANAQKEIKQPEPETIDLKENKNPFPLMFLSNDVYNCFIEYKKHIIDFYTDYSYLKKRLENEKLIHRHTDNDFIKFLFKELNFISEKNYEDYQIKYESKLKSLSKSYSEHRCNNFNIVFKEFIEVK